MQLQIQLKTIKQQLLNEVRTQNISAKLKKTLYYLVKQLDLQKIYTEWVRNNYEDEGIQLSIIDYLKTNVIKTYKDISVDDIEQIALDIVFKTIPQ